MADKNVVTVDQNTAPVAVTPSTVLLQAYEKGAEVEQLTKLLDLQERFEAREAEKAFNEALAKFKANPPKLVKDKEVAFSGTNYKHVSLANLVYTITEALSDYGLSHSWATEQDNGLIRVTCTLTHKLGHKVSTTLSSLADDSGKKNPIQAIGSAVSYLQRYTLFAITGLAAWDQDDDGQASGSQYITFEQAQDIEALLAKVGGDAQKLVEHYGVSSVSELPANSYKSIITTIKAKAKKEEAEGGSNDNS